jgi:hypothetical protein
MAYWTEIDFEDHDAEGDLIDRTVEVTFTVDRGYPGSRTEPPEEPSVEVLDWRMSDGKPAPEWLGAWMDSDYAQAVLLRDAGGIREAALHDAAEARAEMWGERA